MVVGWTRKNSATSSNLSTLFIGFFYTHMVIFSSLPALIATFSFLLNISLLGEVDQCSVLTILVIPVGLA
jgi:hypothetical protein